MKGFFRPERAEMAVLGFLAVFSVAAFLPVWRRIEIAGIAVFGWLMAALMVLSPVLTLAVFLTQRRRR